LKRCLNYFLFIGLSGEGKRVNKFNCVKQSKDYDPVGRYLRHWLPELRAVPAPMIFSPTAYYRKQGGGGSGGGGEGGVLSTSDVTLGVDYPIETCLL
jgi:deoxyribodipyrimidine photolyase